jgi:hypothetical protein
VLRWLLLLLLLLLASTGLVSGSGVVCARLYSLAPYTRKHKKGKRQADFDESQADS